MSDEDTVRIMRAISVEYYHTVPSELEILTITPEQKAIFQYLSAVDPDRFQEFVGDILVLSEGHRLVDVTGGPGDEKQDILTEAPGDYRQLTQCKHTVNYAVKSSGDELDQMFGAAFRKNCKVALYVTNGDLTPQAKRYINDREYLRGSSANLASVPTVEYWTGRQVWERIASNSQILNKWFSGAAQVHGLRNISVRLISTEMPDRVIRECNPESVKSAFNTLGTPFALTADRWFSTLHDVPGTAGQLPLDAPIPALRAQVTETSGTGPFDVDAAVTSAASAALASLGSTSGWFHQFVSAPSSVFMVHDLRRPIMCEVGNARSLIKVGNEIEDELTWSFDPGIGFTRLDDGDLSWTHEATGAGWNVAVVQPIGPHEAYGLALRQQQLIRSASKYKFWRLTSTQRNMDLLQALATREGMILQQGHEHLLLALSMPDGEFAAAQLEAYCSRNLVPYEVLDDDERQKVISHIEELPQSDSKMVSQLRELESPIDLTGRLVSLHLTSRIKGKLPPLWKMLTYKWDYEARWGFDALRGKDHLTLGSEEILGRLFDFQTVRGSRMLDIGLNDKRELLLYLRRSVTSTARASAVASELLGELQRIQEELNSLIE
ncbi:MAG: restriction endonuclease [Candidatus Sulfotelmatobacter sp.]